jgi:hypothetical protein
MTPAAALGTDTLAEVIHDDILQMLGVCLLEAELCRRFWKKGQQEQVVAELNEMVKILEAAAESSHRVLGDARLVAVLAPRRGTTNEDEVTRTRPRLSVVGAAAEVQPLVRPEEILETLDVCTLQVELCRRMYQSGQEQAALVEMASLLQRLETMVEQYRAIMNALRQAAPLARTA